LIEKNEICETIWLKHCINNFTGYQMINSLKKVDEFIAAMEGADTLDQIFSAVRQQIEILGYDRFAYWLVWPPEGGRMPLYINSYPSGWIDYYTDQKYGADDLVMRYAAVQSRPYNWSEVKDKYDVTERQRLVFSEGAEAGLKSGATVPIFGPGKAKAVFSVSNEEPESSFSVLFLKTRHTLHLIATYAHERIIASNLYKQERQNIYLTARELEVLTWTARGKTRWEIAMILNLSDETAKFHLENACRKLGATNKTQATAIALVNGLILP
jgi:DNA-binding CsgD family transcriptional regulator